MLSRRGLAQGGSEKGAGGGAKGGSVGAVAPALCCCMPVLVGNLRGVREGLETFEIYVRREERGERREERGERRETSQTWDASADGTS